jgi:hypothetical protein
VLSGQDEKHENSADFSLTDDRWKRYNPVNEQLNTELQLTTTLPYSGQNGSRKQLEATRAHI